MFKKTTLSSGLRIITAPMDKSKAATVLVLIGTGSRYETKNINGISHFLEHLFFKGTKKRSTPLAIAKELDRVGGMYNAFTGKEMTGFWVKVDSQHLDLALDVLSDMLFNPIFPAAEIEKERNVIFEEINMYYDNPQRYVQNLWETLLYGNQPMGWMISGTRETVAGIRREDIIDYFKKQYVAQNIVISAAGHFSEKEMAAKVKKHFNKFKKMIPQSRKTVAEAQAQAKSLVHFKATDQTHLCLGARAFGLSDSRKYPLASLSTILGGIMSSRLFFALREKRGLAYYVRTTPEHYTDCGYLMTAAGVDNKRVDEAIKIILKEYRRIAKNGISKEELTRARDNIKGHLYLSLETSDAWAAYTASQEMLEGKISTPEEECAKIDKVTREDILKVAKSIFKPDKLNLALVGPFKDKEHFRKLLSW